MTISIIVSVLAGMAIGLRFKVAMLLPATLLAGLLTAVTHAPNGNLGWDTLIAIVLSVLAVQLGYLCGTFAQSIKEIPAQEGEAEIRRPHPATRGSIQYK